VPDPFRTTVLRLGVRSDWLIEKIYRSQCGPSCPPLGPAGLRAWRYPLEQPGFESLIDYQLGHGIPSLSTTELTGLKAVAIPKRVIYGADDPQMSAAGAGSAAATIGAPPPVAIPGRHLTMISSTRQLATALRALSP
jgi:hypothetical protein